MQIKIIQLINGQMNWTDTIQIASKYLKKCSIPLAISQMQIETILWLCLTPVRMVAIKKTKKNNKSWLRYRESEPLYIVDRNANYSTYYGN
jgi:hypothetical protein